MKQKIGVFDVVNTVAMLLITVICVYPFINILAISLSSGIEVMAGNVFAWPRGFNLEAYKQILSNESIGVTRALVNSTLYAVSGTVMATVVTYMTAYCLSRKRFYGRHVFTMLIMFTMMFGGGMIPTYLVMKGLGFVDSPLVMIIPGCISQFLLIIARTYAESIPDELEESAFIDGANDIKIMWRIFLPLSTPIIATIALFYAVGIWNQYMTPLIYLQDKSLHPIQIVLQKLVMDARNSSDSILASTFVNDTVVFPRNMQAAVIVAGMLPILLVYPFAQKYFTKGLLIGSVKG